MSLDRSGRPFKLDSLCQQKMILSHLSRAEMTRTNTVSIMDTRSLS